MMPQPPTWTIAQLGELTAHIVGGGTPSKMLSENFKGPIPFMTVKDMKARFVSATVDHISEAAVTNSSTSKIPADTLIVATRMSLGKIVRPTMDVAINQDLKALFLREEIDKTFIEYFWRSKSQAIQDLGTGTTVKGIRLEDIRSLVVPLAPRKEQKRIADKLDTVLTRVDAVNTRLARVAPILKRFRQSVLAAATSGRLTEEWRQRQHVPEEWCQTDIQDVAHVGTGSTPLRSTPTFYSADGVPWVTSAATSSEIVLGASEYVTREAIQAHRLRIYPIGTLLVAMYGEGKTRGQVTELGIPATINQACAAITVDETKMNRQFVKLSLQANYLEMRVLAEGGNQPNLNLTKIKEFSLPRPSVPEQAEIVRRVEILFAFADRLEARLQAARTATERLTPALLAKAFRGELVPQDPNDEPASELLRRLTQQVDQASAKPQRGRKAAASVQ